MGCKGTCPRKKKPIQGPSSLQRLPMPSENDMEDEEELPPGVIIGKIGPPWSSLLLSGMKLQALAPEIGMFHQLTILDVSSNNIQSIPKQLFMSLQVLKVLNASNNALKVLEPEIDMLEKLEELDVENNELSSLPPQVSRLFRLRRLNYQGNPLSVKLQRALEQGLSQGLRILRERLPQLDGPLPSDRRWLTLLPAQRGTFRMATYNVLAECYSTTQMYFYTPSWALAWDYRARLLLREIFHLMPDIICLQEVMLNHYEVFFLPEMRKAGYDGVYIQKTRARAMPEWEATRVDGCATFVKRERFVIVAEHPLEYSKAIMSLPDFSRDVDGFNRAVVKDNVALGVVVEDVVHGGKMLVVNSHGTWDPRFADVKLCQAQMLCEFIESLTRRSGMPVVIGGDFNSLPSSPVFELMTKGKASGRHPDVKGWEYGHYSKEGFRHGLNLASAFECVGEMPFTNLTAEFDGTIDYVYYSRNRFDVTSLLEPFSKASVRSVGPFPNAHYPSDHITVAVELTPHVHGSKLKPKLPSDWSMKQPGPVQFPQYPYM